MVHATKGIVIRTTAYGETSLIVAIYTEKFGLQSYLVNGARSSKKSNTRHTLFQPAAILDMVVYHNELKNLQRIKEVRWHHLYQNILFSVFCNTIALFMVEILQKTIKQPEHNPDLYNFIEDALLALDQAGGKVLLNFPLYFIIHLTGLFGFTIQDNHSPQRPFLDLRDGNFIAEIPQHPYYLDAPKSAGISEIMKALHPSELSDISLNNQLRRQLTEAMLQFYALHIPDFGQVRSLSILQEVMA